MSRPPSSCHPHTSHVSPRPPSSLYHAHLPRVTLPHLTCRSATFIIVPRPPSSCHPHTPRVARPTFIIVPRPPHWVTLTSQVSFGPTSSLCHAHLPRVTLPHPTYRSAHLNHCATPTFIVSPSHIPRVARPTFIIVPRPPSSCHPHIPGPILALAKTIIVTQSK